MIEFLMNENRKIAAIDISSFLNGQVLTFKYLARNTKIVYA